MVLNRVNTRYIIELYCTDWNTWSKAQKESVIFHELLHPDYEVGKIVKHDVEDFQIMIDKLGCNWFGNKDLPSLLETKVDFDLSLRPNVPEDGGLEVDTGDEIVEDVDAFVRTRFRVENVLTMESPSVWNAKIIEPIFVLKKN